MKRIFVFSMVIMLVVCSCCSCAGTDANKANQNLDVSKNVMLKVCGPWADSKAIEMAAQAFNDKYPNCDVEYEYVQNYEDSLVKRFESDPDTVDLFLTENIQEGSCFYPYAEELFSHSELDLSNTNDALIKTYTYKDANSTSKNLFAIPLGGELRGLYVNKSLLASVNEKVPTNLNEFLKVCNTLKEAGYIPINGNPGMFGQRFLYPYICNLIANSNNYEETFNRVNKCEKGISNLFREPLKLMYELTQKYYYNYKYVETEQNMFIDNSDEGCARDFFHIVENGESYKKVDDLGMVAFMTGTMSQQSTMNKVKDDYHSTIDYEFILAPVSDEGGFAYVSPAKGIAVNKNSSQKDWAIEFMSFLFSKDVNTQYAVQSNIISNTKNSFDFIHQTFDIPENHITDVGKVTFDYEFYDIINNVLVAISKSNNPKYMNKDKDGKSVMYDFDYYMNQLEDAFAKQREKEAE